MSIEQVAQVAVSNLTSAPVLAFAFALAVTVLLRTELRLPQPVYTALSMYLLLAIGLKGGVALRGADLSSLLAPALAAILLGAVIPVAVFHLLRWMTGLSATDRGAMAAHYGSTSLVTFTAAVALLEAIKLPFEGHVVTLLTIMEIPGIIVGLLLARSSGAAVPLEHQRVPAAVRAGGVGGSGEPDPASAATVAVGDASPWSKTLREVLTGPSVLLLVGGLIIGAAAGPAGYANVAPLFTGLFPGLLAVFLLHLGAVAGAQLRSLPAGALRIVPFALLFPLVAGAAGVMAGTATGLSIGGSALLGVLCASASYIAAPAAVGLALPEADEGLCLASSLALTFPLNLVLGIPVLIALASAVGA